MDQGVKVILWVYIYNSRKTVQAYDFDLLTYSPIEALC